VWTELAHRTSAFAAKYDFWRGPENERQLDAARLLLTAIQAGRIRPIDENGRIVPRGKWAHATPGDWPDVRMLRDEILRGVSYRTAERVSRERIWPCRHEVSRRNL
jgi:hypothetical protein